MLANIRQVPDSFTFSFKLHNRWYYDGGGWDVKPPTPPKTEAAPPGGTPASPSASAGNATPSGSSATADGKGSEAVQKPVTVISGSSQELQVRIRYMISLTIYVL